MLNCDWSVAGRLMRQMSLTRTHHATVVGPIRFSNRSNNCRVCKINGRQLSLVRTHHATIVFSSSLRPTDNKNRMVCAGLYSYLMLIICHGGSWSLLHTSEELIILLMHFRQGCQHAMWCLLINAALSKRYIFVRCVFHEEEYMINNLFKKTCIIL